MGARRAKGEIKDGPYRDVGLILFHARDSRRNPQTSQDQFAIELGRELGRKISQKTIGNWEHGHGHPDAEELAALQATLRVNARQLGFMIARDEELVGGFGVPVVGADLAGQWMRAARAGEPMLGESRLELRPDGMEFLSTGERVFWVEAFGKPLTFDDVQNDSLLLVEPRAELDDGQTALVLLDGQLAVRGWATTETHVLLTDLRTHRALDPIPQEEFARRGIAFRVTMIRPAPRRL